MNQSFIVILFLALFSSSQAAADNLCRIYRVDGNRRDFVGQFTVHNKLLVWNNHVEAARGDHFHFLASDGTSRDYFSHGYIIEFFRDRASHISLRKILPSTFLKPDTVRDVAEYRFEAGQKGACQTVLNRREEPEVKDAFIKMFQSHHDLPSLRTLDPSRCVGNGGACGSLIGAPTST